MKKADKSNEQCIQSLEYYRKTWAESLEQFQKVMEASAPYLQIWTEYLEKKRSTCTGSLE